MFNDKNKVDYMKILINGFLTVFFFVFAFSNYILSTISVQMTIKTRLHNIINDLNSGFYKGSIPHPKYPRPQFKRKNSIYMNLNGFWNYKIVKYIENNEITVSKGQILVPFPPESSLSGVKHVLQPDEYLIYMKTINVDSNSPLSKLYENRSSFLTNNRLFLNIDACDYYVTIQINKETCFDDHIGYIPTSVEITKHFVFGKNEIAIRVRDPTDKGLQPVGKQTLKPTRIYYTSCSGIWQTIWLETTPLDYIKDIKITPNIAKNSVTLRYNYIKMKEKQQKEEVKVFVYDKSDHSQVIYNTKKILNENENQIELIFGDIKIDQWSPEQPNLYDFEIIIGQDEVISYFGMREFGLKTINGYKQLTLNGKPYFMSGLLDQGYWPESNLSPPSEEAMIFDIMYAKSSGFNMLRKHIKYEPFLFYYHCDRLGLIVWQDIVNGGMPHKPRFFGPINDSTEEGYDYLHRSDEQSRIEFEEFIVNSINCLYNVVSIGLWTLFNEGWGQFDSIRLTKLITEKLDNSRPIDSTSGYYDQGENIGQFFSIHIYYESISIDKNANDNRSIILSEFGGFSYKTDDSHLFCPTRSFGYIEFDSLSELKKGFESLYRDEVMQFIQKGLCATVYTQLSDVELEINGLITYDRKVKKLSPEFLSAINNELYKKYYDFVNK